jgi:uncharacterized protein (DUF1778 family)
MATAVLDRQKKDERLGFRATREVKETVERAACLQGVTVSDFVTASAYREAVQTIKENELIRLNREASLQFVETLLNPPAPNAALRALMKVNR